MKGVAVTQTQKANQQQDRHGPPVLQTQVISLKSHTESFKAINANLIKKNFTYRITVHNWSWADILRSWKMQDKSQQQDCCQPTTEESVHCCLSRISKKPIWHSIVRRKSEMPTSTWAHLKLSCVHFAVNLKGHYRADSGVAAWSWSNRYRSIRLIASSLLT